MKKFAYFLVVLAGIFAATGCVKEKSEEKDVINLSLDLLTDGAEFRADTLLAPIEGYSSVELLIKNSENMSLNRVDFKLEFSENTFSDDNWYNVSASGDRISVIVKKFPTSKETYRSVKVTITGISEYYDIKPVSFTIYQINYERNKACWVESFTIPGQTRPTDIYLDQVIVVQMPYGTDVTNLTPTIKVSPKATCDPASGVAQDFSKDVKYTVTAEDGGSLVWIAKVELAEEPNHEAEILEFSVNGLLDKAIIGENTITASVDESMDIKAMQPVTKLSEGATVTPKNGETVDFTNPVEFTVTAEDGQTVKKYTVTVTKAGKCNLNLVGEPAEGILVSDNNYTIPADGSTETDIQTELLIAGEPVSDLSKYEYNISTTDLKDNSEASWIKISDSGNGAFAFSIEKNDGENVRRGQIIVEASDPEGKYTFAKGILNIAQNGTGEVSSIVELIFVKGGRFLQGEGNEEGTQADSLRWCNLSDFYIGKYEITQSQFETVMGFNPSSFKKDGANRPVETVTFWDAMEFCDKLSEREGYSTFYNLTDKEYVGNNIVKAKRNCNMKATGYRLPTIAEFEYAAKGGEEQINNKVYSFAGCEINELKDYAWFRENNGERPEIVGTKLPNTLGIYDMSGNVSEWCHDFVYDWHIGLYPSTEEVFDPFGPEEPYDSDEYVYTRGGYFDTYDFNLNIIRGGTQYADAGLGDPGHMCRADAFGIRVVIRK